MDKFQRLTFYALLLYPFLGFITWSTFNVPPYYVSTLLILISFAILIKNKQGSILFPKYLKVFTLFLIATFLSIYIFHQTSLKFDTFLGQIIFILNPLLLFLIIENSIITENFIKTSRKIMLFLLFTAVIVSILQYFSASFLQFTGQRTSNAIETIGFYRRIPSIFAWGDFIKSTYVATGFVIIYGILLIEYSMHKILMYVLPIIVGTVVFLHQLRAAMISYLIITLFIYFKKLSFKSLTYIVIIWIGFEIMIRFLGFDVDYFVENRLKSESAGTRIEAINAFLYAFPKNPLFGTGGVRTEALFEGYGRVTRLHNGHLAMTYYYGLIAFIPYLWFLILLTKKTYRTAKYVNYRLPFLGVIVLVLVSSTMPRVTFFLPGIIYMMVFNKYYFDKYLLKNASINKQNKNTYT